jgi:hypothetical protein
VMLTWKRSRSKFVDLGLFSGASLPYHPASH